LHKTNLRLFSPATTSLQDAENKNALCGESAVFFDVGPEYAFPELNPARENRCGLVKEKDSVLATILISSDSRFGFSIGTRGILP
jgi:hypothetical protein